MGLGRLEQVPGSSGDFISKGLLAAVFTSHDGKESEGKNVTVGAEGPTIVCVRLDDDSPWWRSSGGLLSLQRVVVFGVPQRW